MPWRRLMLVGGAVLAALVAGGELAVALTVATGGTGRSFPSMDRFVLRWAAGSAATATVTGLLKWPAQAWPERRYADLGLAIQRFEPWAGGPVRRPGQRVACAERRQQRDPCARGNELHHVRGQARSGWNSSPESLRRPSVIAWALDVDQGLCLQGAPGR